ncbi:MAG: hypothetical protein Q8M39_11310 [Sulfuricurvum sp.]|nr:hypothetical protein [Sulfuricurvum sp.]
MATQKPRIIITFENHEYELLKRFAKLSGSPMSKVIRELVEPALEPLERLCVMMEGINISTKEVHEGMSSSFKQVAQDMEPFLKDVIDQADMFLTKFEQISETQKPRLVTTGVGTLSPPPINQDFRG